MIDFSLDEDAQILCDAVERFSREQLVPHARSAEAERAPGPDAVRVYESLGLIGLEAPGGGLGMLTRCLVNEVLARGDPGSALALDRLGPAGYALWAAGDHETAAAVTADPARRAWLATVDDGALDISERTASGTVHFAPAGVTDLLLLTPAGIALVRDGLVAEPVRGAGLRAAAPVRLILDAAPVARFHPVEVAPVLARARLYVASLVLGVMDAASTYARDYAQQRIAFGRPIAHHQAMTFLLTDMNTAVTGLRLLIQEAAWRVDAAEPGSRENAESAASAYVESAASAYAESAASAYAESAASAYAEAVEQSAFIGPNAVQVLGGVGFMQDYPVEKQMREARALGLLYGGIDRARADAIRSGTTAIMAGGVF